MINFRIKKVKIYLGYLAWLGFAYLATACTMDARITDLNPKLEGANLVAPQHLEVDFVAGEIVTTDSGAMVTGAFGEISEKKQLSNGVVIEGAFYQ
jgi:hypothetical protein